MTRIIARTLAAMLGTIALVSAAAASINPIYNPAIWLVDLRGWPVAVSAAALLIAAALWIAFAVKPGAGHAWRTRATCAATLGLTLVALCDAARFAWLVGRGHIDSALPLPMSLGVIAVGGVMLRGIMRPGGQLSHARAAGVAFATACTALLAFTLGQMFTFGKTDYRRPADAIVVFGARAYADGRPSDALADRVRTACDLYHAGYAPLLVMSGGPGDGDIHETQAMRRMAMGLGVPDEAIRLDPTGVNTRATARATATHGRILTVSHFYHLPRVKLTYQRAGVEVFTVPARERYTLTKMPLLIAREVAAIWYYAFTA
jgi:vancomycin permeability regulator SanA